MLPLENHYHHNSPPPAPRIDIETLVDTRLPPSPGGIMRITTVLRDYNASTSKIAEAINFEPALVTRILRLANSPIYALEKNVATVQQAINSVGTVMIHDIVMMELTSKTFANSMYKSTEVRTIWKHSLAVALLARELSKILKNRGAEEAFVCGLLHDIGKIILLAHDENSFKELEGTATEGEMLRMEMARFGYSHAEVGALVARRWGLPDDVCYSILHHHDPSQSEKQMIATRLVDVSDMIANFRGLGLRKEEEPRFSYSESAIQLGLTAEQMEEAWQTVEKSLDEVMAAFA